METSSWQFTSDSTSCCCHFFFGDDELLEGAGRLALPLDEEVDADAIEVSELFEFAGPLPLLDEEVDALDVATM